MFAAISAVELSCTAATLKLTPLAGVAPAVPSDAVQRNRLTSQSTTGSIVEHDRGGASAPAAFAKLFRGTRPLKRWRYVGIFGDGVMACAAQVRIGPARQSFWALQSSPDGRMRERTRMLPRRQKLQLDAGLLGGRPGRIAIRDGGVLLDLQLEEQPGIQARCPHGRGEVWTRKQAGLRAYGTLSLDGEPAREVEALAVIDDTAGYHERVTEWRWSAGVGQAPDGTALAWNLVQGINDPRHGSERAIWVDGEPHEAAPVSFAADLGSIRCEDGSELRFRASAERARRENLLIVSSDYRAPFGHFDGTLPGGVELASGLGVMEQHRARW
jgi:hypothetical protein